MTETVEQISCPIENVSSIADKSDANSEEILSSVGEVTIATNDVAKSAQNKIVMRFSIHLK